VKRRDVCIVGGSLAGGTLACLLASEGFDVAVVERRWPGERKLCAELTAATLLDRLVKLAGIGREGMVSAELDRVVVTAGPRRLERSFTLGKGITADRVAIEARLLDRATALGATVLGSEAAVRVAVSDTTALVETERREVEAEVVVGADGAASLVARTLLRAWRRDEVGATRHARLAVPPTSLPDGPSTMRFDLVSEVSGYGWAVPYGDAIGLGIGGMSGAIGPIFDRMLERIGVAPDVAAAARRGVRGAPVPSSGPCRGTHGTRFLLVGDAAGFVSPASGEGMSLAVESAVAAASALKLAFARGRFDARSMRHHERFWRVAMPDFDALRRFRDALAGDAALRWLDACGSDLERLALLAPLVGPPDTGPAASQILERLRAAHTS
jgi:flavin-dependent dehydrogenase